MNQPIQIARIETFRLRASVDSLPSSTLGAMQARNGLLVRIEDTDGAFGWGEVWCNFPPHASQSRQQLLRNVIGPELIGRSFAQPRDVRPNLEERWTTMATHVGEPGPFGHCIAGIDMAAWDLAARRAGKPLSAILSSDPAAGVKAMVQPPWERLRDMYHPAQYNEEPRNLYYHHIVNREFMKEEKDFCSVRCFDGGLEFLDLNRAADNWLLQIETFDPHEPFFAPTRYRDDYPTNYAGPVRDWPPYERVTEAPDECAELRANYCAIVALCDAQIGRLLDYFDQHDMWQDTALVVGTDHGFLLGEHDWWAKIRMPCYDEVAHIPLFIHHPDHAARAGTRRQSLTQTIDLMPTLLDLFGVEAPKEVEGRSLLPLLNSDTPIRQAGIYGVWASATNITDGRFTYFRYPDNMHAQEIYQYTLMPTHITSFFTTDELRTATLSPPFDFTKGVPVLKVSGHAKSPMYRNQGMSFFQDTETVLFDTKNDPEQRTPISSPEIVTRLVEQMLALMRVNDAPPEAYVRLGLGAPTSAAI